MPSVQISAVIITYNEERNIGRCLASLAQVADDIVVLDSFSSDGTEAICRAHGARFEQYIFDGHIEQKNRALLLAAYNHVLSLDADEALSPELAAAILSAKADWSAQGYTMNRLTNYCGQWIRHSGWYPDRKLRLFDRQKAHWGGTNPHDKVELDAATLHLSGDLLHYSYYTVEEHVLRARKYAEIAAHALHKQGKKASWGQLLLSPVFKFIRNYLLKGGFRDGTAGFTICKIAALETYWKYLILKNLGKHSVNGSR